MEKSSKSQKNIDASTSNNEQSAVHQRLKVVLDSFANSNMSELARLIGVRSGVVTDMFGKRQNKPSFDLLAKIANALPLLRLEWLLTGEGEMLKSTQSQAQSQNSASYTPPGEVLSPDGTTNVRSLPIEAQDFKVLPYLPVSARAGIVEHYADDSRPYKWENRQSLAVFGVPDTPEFKNALIVDVEGDSMEDTLIDGSKVVITPVQKGNWEYLNRGIYCVIYNSNFVIKRIKDNTLMESGLLRLHSDNPKAGSFAVKGEDIRAIWRVRFAAYVPIY